MTIAVKKYAKLEVTFLKSCPILFESLYFVPNILSTNGISSHQRNIQMLMTELWKIIKEHAPPIMESNSNGRSITYNFRKLQEFQSEKERTVFYSLETLSHKQRNTGNLFKSGIKQWICKKRPSRLCNVFVPKLGFIWHMALSWYCLWFEL